MSGSMLSWGRITPEHEILEKVLRGGCSRTDGRGGRWEGTMRDTGRWMVVTGNTDR